MCDTNTKPESSSKDIRSNTGNAPHQHATLSSGHKQMSQSQWLRLTPSPSPDREELMQKLCSILQIKERLEKEYQEAKVESAKWKELVESERTKLISIDPEKDVQQTAKTAPVTIEECDLLKQKLGRTVKKLEKEFKQLGEVLKQRDVMIEQLRKENKELQKEMEHGDWKILQASKGNAATDEEKLLLENK